MDMAQYEEYQLKGSQDKRLCVGPLKEKKRIFVKKAASYIALMCKRSYRIDIDTRIAERQRHIERNIEKKK